MNIFKLRNVFISFLVLTISFVILFLNAGLSHAAVVTNVYSSSQVDSIVPTNMVVASPQPPSMKKYAPGEPFNFQIDSFSNSCLNTSIDDMEIFTLGTGTEWSNAMSILGGHLQPESVDPTPVGGSRDAALGGSLQTDVGVDADSANYDWWESNGYQIAGGTSDFSNFSPVGSGGYVAPSAPGIYRFFFYTHVSATLPPEGWWCYQGTAGGNMFRSVCNLIREGDPWSDFTYDDFIGFITNPVYLSQHGTYPNCHNSFHAPYVDSSGGYCGAYGSPGSHGYIEGGDIGYRLDFVEIEVEGSSADVCPPDPMNCSSGGDVWVEETTDCCCIETIKVPGEEDDCETTMNSDAEEIANGCSFDPNDGWVYEVCTGSGCGCEDGYWELDPYDSPCCVEDEVGVCNNGQSYTESEWPVDDYKLCLAGSPTPPAEVIFYEKYAWLWNCVGSVSDDNNCYAYLSDAIGSCGDAEDVKYKISEESSGWPPANNVLCEDGDPIDIKETKDGDGEVIGWTWDCEGSISSEEDCSTERDTSIGGDWVGPRISGENMNPNAVTQGNSCTLHWTVNDSDSDGTCDVYDMTGNPIETNKPYASGGVNLSQGDLSPKKNYYIICTDGISPALNHTSKVLGCNLIPIIIEI